MGELGVQGFDLYEYVYDDPSEPVSIQVDTVSGM